MKTKRLSILSVTLILSLILFDALQQKYYLDTFNLAPEGIDITLADLFKNHLIRWTIWAFYGSIYALLLKKLIRLKAPDLSNRQLIGILTLILIFIALDVISISIMGIIKQEQPLTLPVLQEFLYFNAFQKGMTFFLAYATLTLLLYHLFSRQIIEEQIIEIRNLRRTSSQLEQMVMSGKEDREPHLTIKTGHRMKPLALREIIWIQADDYCVRVHTERRTFTLRKSLKSLEADLAPYRFVRVHRGALLNLDFLDQVHVKASRIKLTDQSELPLSKAGLKTIKQAMDRSSL